MTLPSTTFIPFSALQAGVVSTDNSTATLLAAGHTFTGEWEDVSGYPAVVIATATDQDGTLTVQFSPDGTNVDSTLTYAYTTTLINPPHRLTVTRRYVRVVFQNTSASDQTYLRLQALYGSAAALTSALGSTLAPNFDSIVTRAVSDELTIANGEFQGYFIVNKFGRNPDVDTGSLPEDIWSGGGVYTGFPTGAAETIEVLSSSDEDTLTTGTGAWTARVFGLDASGNLQEETVNLNGTTGVTTANTFFRVNRVRVLTGDTTGSNTNVGTITVRHSSTTANIFAVLPATDGQTRVACYTVPAGYTAYLRHYQLTMSDNNANQCIFGIWVRESGGAVRVIRTQVGSTAYPSGENIWGGVPFPGLTDLAFRVLSVKNNDGDVSVNFDLLVVRN